MTALLPSSSIVGLQECLNPVSASFLQGYSGHSSSSPAVISAATDYGDGSLVDRKTRLLDAHDEVRSLTLLLT